MAWTKGAWRDVARTRLGGARLVVVANREPFIHVYDGERHPLHAAGQRPDHRAGPR